MAYHLLTGATGLLGNYLLRDLLLAGRQVAVIVRPSRMETARQRIESILGNWERSLGRVLPRPPVLEGDMCEPRLGLDSAALDWVKYNCDSMIHNAASLSFEADEKTGEPYRSNVEGTANVLALCEHAGLRRFHHVSTAYVCGLRTGRIFEDELDVGQTLGNAYEQSKVQAEKLVRGAAFFDSLTVYRPAIIIGDSSTGYTTTFHGFYTPLKIVHALINHIDVTQVDGSPMLAAMNLSGHERKNYVPVDWVSRAITWLSGRTEHHGRTYHLTPRRGVTMSTTCRAIEEVLRQPFVPTQTGGIAPPSLEEILHTFTEQMETYRAYWRDDPEFDQTNTTTAAPHLPCPEVDMEMLVRTAAYARNANFGWPRPQPVLPSFDVQEHLRGRMPVGFENGHDLRQVQLIGVQVNGPGGGQWTLVVEAGRPVAAQCGLVEQQQAFLSLNSRTFQRFARGEITVQEAYQRGQLALEGKRALSSGQVLDVLQAAAGLAAAP